MNAKTLFAAAFSLLLVANSTFAASDSSELAALKARVAELEAKQNESWLNQRRAEEVKTLISEVLADADTRASLQEGGMTAGHNGNFFLASEDGTFLMEIDGQIQFRWIWNNQEDASDEDISGFQLRRTKLGFSGHVGSPKIEYKLVLAVDRDNDGDGGGNVFMEDVVVSYKIMDGLKIKAGKFKLPFARQELISSKRQLAVDRSLATEAFTLNRAEQIQLAYAADMFKIAAAFSDGANSGHSDFDATGSEIALTARVDVKIMGEWGQAKDVVAWQGEDTAVFVGAAVHYETGDASMGFFADSFLWTVDGQVEVAGFSALGAVYGNHVDFDAGGDQDDFGFVVEGGYMVIPDKLQPFVRYDYIDADNAGADEVHAVTLGANWFIRKHKAKFTLDGVWILEYDGTAGPTVGGAAANDGQFSSGLGLRDLVQDESQFAVRAQFQLLF